jgi:hypothetical protein
MLMMFFIFMNQLEKSRLRFMKLGETSIIHTTRFAKRVEKKVMRYNVGYGGLYSSFMTIFLLIFDKQTLSHGC